MAAGNGNGTKAVIVRDKNGLESLMGQMKDKIRDVLPKHLTPERVVKQVMVAASRNPRLFDCTQMSIAKSMMDASELGLDCSGSLGQGYLVPFFNGKLQSYESQFIPGYRGLIDLARRSGKIASIEAHNVHQKDSFEIEYGLNPKLSHRPYVDGDPGKIKLSYAIAKMTDGSMQVEVMTGNQVEAIRQRSKAKDSGPWVTDTEEMYRKTVIKRLCKYLPLSPELARAIEIDDDVTGIDINIPDINTPEEPEVKSKTETLVDKLTGEITQPPPPVSDLITPEQVKELLAIAKKHKIGREDLKAIVKNEYNVEIEGIEGLSFDCALALIDRFKQLQLD